MMLITALSEKDKEKYGKQKKRESNRFDRECEKEVSRVAHQRRNEMKQNLFWDLNERVRTTLEAIYRPSVSPFPKGRCSPS
eukprot:scaffold142127_cov63-Attheya_sp.AAC.1